MEILVLTLLVVIVDTKLIETRCAHFIAGACRILDQLLDEQKKGARRILFIKHLRSYLLFALY